MYPCHFRTRGRHAMPSRRHNSVILRMTSTIQVIDRCGTNDEYTFIVCPFVDCDKEYLYIVDDKRYTTLHTHTSNGFVHTQPNQY